jgi:hypothetical protein
MFFAAAGLPVKTLPMASAAQSKMCKGSIVSKVFVEEFLMMAAILFLKE